MSSTDPPLPDSDPPRRFSPTRWSLVRRAVLGGEALDSWIGIYWYPLYAWARSKGNLPEDAADEVQEFMAKICSRELLNTVDPERGKLRNWLLTSFSNHLHSSHKRANREKRGGGTERISIDRPGAENTYLANHLPGVDPDAVYSRAWALTVMDEAVERLASHFAQSGRMELFNALLPALENTLPDHTTAEAAAALGMKPAAFRQAVVRFRQRYRRILLELASERLGITCEIRLHAELRELLGG